MARSLYSVYNARRVQEAARPLSSCVFVLKALVKGACRFLNKQNRFFLTRQQGASTPGNAPGEKQLLTDSL